MAKKKQVDPRYVWCTRFVCGNCCVLKRNKESREVEEMLRYDGVHIEEKCKDCTEFKMGTLRRA
jgi:hypothetical protein